MNPVFFLLVALVLLAVLASGVVFKVFVDRTYAIHGGDSLEARLRVACWIGITLLSVGTTLRLVAHEIGDRVDVGLGQATVDLGRVALGLGAAIVLACIVRGLWRER